MYFIPNLTFWGARSWAANVDGSRYAPGLERGYRTAASRASLPHGLPLANLWFVGAESDGGREGPHEGGTGVENGTGEAVTMGG